jgi:NADH:ubiquinone oxidoreductase subunit 2 (subunit N)
MKRMLAYPSIAHAGYLMIGICAMPYTRYAVPSILLYTAAYLFMNLGAFAIVTMLGRRLHSDEIKSYSGLIKRSPVLAFTMVFFLLSLAGIPPTAGFLGKFYLFAAALGARNAICFWLAIAAIINTVISVYYYMNVVRQMFFVEPEHSARIAVTPPIAVAVGITFVVTLVMLIYPQPFIDIASRSAWLIGI